MISILYIYTYIHIVSISHHQSNFDYAEPSSQHQAMGHQQRFVGTKSGYPMVSQNTVVSYHDYVGVFMAIPVMWLNPTINLQFGDDTPIYGDFGHDLFFFGLPHYPTLPPHFQTQPIQLPFCFHSLNPQPPGPQGCFTLPQVLQPWMIRVANGCELFRPGNRSATLCPGFYMFLWSYQGEFGHIKIVNYASVIKTRDKHSMMNIIHHYPLWIHCSNSLSWNKADLMYIYICYPY